MVKVVIGRLVEPDEIRLEETAEPVMPKRWRYRAMWSWLRLQYGRSIDASIRAALEEEAEKRGLKHYADLPRTLRKAIVWNFFKGHASPPEGFVTRKIQFILDDTDNVMAVASLKHLLIPPEEVYMMADKIMTAKYPQAVASDNEALLGQVYEMAEDPLLNKGIQIHGGTITTRQAIVVSLMFGVKMCLNPLSWLGIGGFRRFIGDGKDYERVLRIKHERELEPRLTEAIESVWKKKAQMDIRIQKTKLVKMDTNTAWLLVSAMGLSYHLGKKAIQQVMDKFSSEDPSQYGLAMAESWAAAHGTFKKTGKKQKRAVEQRLSTVAGATLLIDDMKKAKEASVGWLKKYLAKGKLKTVDEILKELK